MKNRRNARILALQLMYALDLRIGEEVDTVFIPMLAEFRSGSLTEDEVVIPEEELDDTVSYARLIAATANEKRVEIDAIIAEYASNWDIGRMAAIDRNIMRMAITEIDLKTDGVPFKVIVDEAIEIAKAFGSDDSGRFVNGVIDAVRLGKKVDEPKRKPRDFSKKGSKKGIATEKQGASPESEPFDAE